ncbi:MAG: pseudouridine synthase [Candidatus Nomurabacteria bacterium]|nr:pseudouridine synthase [Candidatus Nomurabacteria bacterium]
MRINKYLALHNFSTRRGADGLIEKGLVFINGKKAKLGDQVEETDKVELKGDKKEISKSYVYYAYNKPIGTITHSPSDEEVDIKEKIKGKNLPSDVFPIGRLDKASHGLIILTNDGRITDKLLNPKYIHEKEYVVKTLNKLRTSFKAKMEAGVNIDDYKTKKCIVKIIDENTFRITLTEGKKHQIRRMCSALFQEVADLKRVRIMNIRLGSIRDNEVRKIEGPELKNFLELVLK